MKMMSMACTPEEEASEKEGAEIAEGKYPYGLVLNLDQETLTKLGLEKMPAVGTVMMIEAKVQVCSSSQYESMEGKNKSLSLQITDLGIEGKKKPASEALYGKE